MKEQSQYNSTENLKITYLLGAGASYQAIPIWKEQGVSMVEVAKSISAMVLNIPSDLNSRDAEIFENPDLFKVKEKIEYYGRMAIEYGSIDIYARRLALLNDYSALNDLKLHLSIYFDLWEKFEYKSQSLYRDRSLVKIDKRYYGLLSIILEQTEGLPKVNDNISFISWNYDLQLEMAYAAFMPNEIKLLKEINSGFNFMGNAEDERRQNIIHLNGHRGFFKADDEPYETERSQFSTMPEYLRGLLDNNYQFRQSKMIFKDYMKYAWEADSETLEKAKNVMRTTDILVIIGYSFPSFNRDVDMQLIRAFEETSYYKIIYQDPYANSDVVSAIFNNPEDVEINKDNVSQFIIPHEFLSPSPGKKPFFGI